MIDVICLHFRRRLSEASRPKLKSLFAKVASNLSVNMRKNREMSKTALIDSSEKQPSTTDRDNNDDYTEQQSSAIDSAQQSTTISGDHIQHSDAESTHSSADEPSDNDETDAKIDKSMLGQIYVDPMIAKLKITDVILPLSAISPVEYRFEIYFHF